MFHPTRETNDVAGSVGIGMEVTAVQVAFRIIHRIEVDILEEDRNADVVQPMARVCHSEKIEWAQELHDNCEDIVIQYVQVGTVDVRPSFLPIQIPHINA